jgi:hypothetical protein
MQHDDQEMLGGCDCGVMGCLQRTDGLNNYGPKTDVMYSDGHGTDEQ